MAVALDHRGERGDGDQGSIPYTEIGSPPEIVEDDIVREGGPSLSSPSPDAAIRLNCELLTIADAVDVIFRLRFTVLKV
jgi:hypothetical protein